MAVTKPLVAYSKAEAEARQQILKLVADAVGKPLPAELEIDYPPDPKMGDFSVPCFTLAKLLDKSPAEIAATLAVKIAPAGLLASVVATGPYLNFKLNPELYTKAVLSEIRQAGGKYGFSKLGRGKKVMVEYFSPNTNKPMTIGHLRNICLGWTLSRLLEAVGYKIVESTLYNDRGIAIAKTIVGFRKWGKGLSPKQQKLKPDHFVGNFYVQFAQAAKEDPTLDQEAQKTLRDWEAGKKEVMASWQKLMGWVHEGYRQTLTRLGVGPFDEEYYESEYYTHGKEIVEQGLAKRIFKKHAEGYVYADLEQYGMPNKVLLRSDGTSLYITQDLYLASRKNQHKLDQSIYVVASEQDLQLQQLFKILELLHFDNIKHNYHLSYGMVRLPSGRIKSREGLAKGTGADELLDTLTAMAGEEIRKRGAELDPKQLETRAEQIALAALKFYLLHVDPKTTMIFDPEKSLAFTGQTGPYLQYVHARIVSIFTKAGQKRSPRIDGKQLVGDAEFALTTLLGRFPNVVSRAAITHNPALLSEYLYELAKAFSVFYEHVPVLQAEPAQRNARLQLLDGVRIVLAQGLKLIGIAALDQM